MDGGTAEEYFDTQIRRQKESLLDLAGVGNGPAEGYASGMPFGADDPPSGQGALRRCWAEIDGRALRRNLGALRAILPKSAAVMAVVKANAYGHGLEEVVKTLSGKVEMFGVANLAEARGVRCVAPDVEVFLLGPALPEERAEIVRLGIIPSVSNLREAHAYGEAAGEGGAGRARVHAVIDTGMGRMGIWQDEAVKTVREIYGVAGVEITGIATHLPSADEDAEFSEAQLSAFRELVARLRPFCSSGMVAHVENSAGALRWPGSAGEMVRPGLALYGCSPLPEFQDRLTPVLTWKTRVTLVRQVATGRSVSYGRTFITPGPMRIATLAVGYADGYRRHLSNSGADVLIRGRRRRVLGRVTMDQILVDVSEVPAVEEGDEAVLLGTQGGETILTAEMARLAGTIPWEILTGLGARVERVYH